MSLLLSLGAIVLNALVVLGMVVALRGSARPATTDGRRRGWAAVSGYAGVVIAALLIWGRSAEGIGIATILVGMPWSFALVFLLDAVRGVLDLPRDATWSSMLQWALIGPLLLNGLALYQLGTRLPLRWRTAVSLPKQ